MQNFLIDTHAHLTSDVFNSNIDSVIADAKADNVGRIITVGYDVKSSKQAVKLAVKYDMVYAAVGIHPSDIKCANFFAFKQLKTLAKHPKVVAIGEIGLDYHYQGFNKKKQVNTLIKQLKLARSLHLPVVIHTRDANTDILHVLLQHKHLLTNSGVVHCFDDDYDFYKKINKLGLKVSVNGIITFKNSQTLKNAVKQIPLENIMLETDCPYLTPVPFRGKAVNQPRYVTYVANTIAQLKQKTPQEICDITTKNAFDVFKKMK